jgi:hypothetical protein
MVTAGKFGLIEVTVSVFSPVHAPINHTLLLAAVLNKHAARFNGEVQSIPIPGNAPPQIPRVALGSKNGEWHLDSPLCRISSRWSSQSDDSQPKLGEIVEACLEPILDYLERDNDVCIGRLALIIGRAVSAENPPVELVERFCNEDAKTGPLRNSRDFQLHNHKQYESGRIGTMINSWVRCKSGHRKRDKSRVIVVEHDINTLAERLGSEEFSADDLRSFFRHAADEANEVLEVYFPD